VSSSQPTTFSPADLVIRPAGPADRAALEAIAAQTWNGHDYLPLVLDDWFADPVGEMVVAAVGERVVGVTQLTRFAPDEWWMEGLRVDPAYHRHGIARRLNQHMNDAVDRCGQGVVRFATASINKAVRRLAEHSGFERTAVLAPYGAEALHEPVRALWPLEPDDAPRVRAWLAVSDYFERAQRSLESDWSFYFLTDARLAERLAAGLVYGWPLDGDPARLGGVLVINAREADRWPEDEALKIAYMDADTPQLSALAEDARRLAAAQGRAHAHIKIVSDRKLYAALRKAGYRRTWKGLVWLFQRDISQRRT
jgi:RimJ/RimL family protein N-acetyltransferase